MSARELMADETFREVADLLFGSGAPESFSKANPDGADLSAGERKKKNERTQARIGLASNIVGLAAGVAGTKDAYGAYKQQKRTPKGARLLSSAKVSGKTKALAGGALGLQVANIAGDAVANRVLARSAKKDPNVKGGAMTAGRVAVAEGKKRKDQIHKGHLVPLSKSAKDIPESAQSPKKGKGGGKVTLAPMPSKRGTGAGNKFSAGHFKRLPEKIKRGPAVSKSANLDVKWEGEISKVNEDKRQVFGWASIVELNGEPVVDLQGDYISIDEVEKSAYEYVHKSRKGGDMHLRDNLDGADRVVHKSDMIESMVVTPEKKKALGLPESAPTGWWVGYQVNDEELWQKVKNGERTGFSIHGRGVRSPA